VALTPKVAPRSGGVDRVWLAVAGISTLALVLLVILLVR
jgi:hypothetical protein